MSTLLGLSPVYLNTNGKYDKTFDILKFIWAVAKRKCTFEPVENVQTHNILRMRSLILALCSFY